MNTSGELIEWLKELGRRVETSSQIVDEKLTKNMQLFNSRLDNAAVIIGHVQKSIGEFSEIGRSMRELQQFLSSPKLRGTIGENILKDLLAQYFPPESYVLQYSFKSGDRVDAIIKTSQGIIPIDSKFPMENFRKMHSQIQEEEKNKLKKQFTQDVKKHIEDIAKKYILVSEGTVDYAIIYIPSETIYYEILTNQELLEYAARKRTLPVSPLCFYAYMKAILMSFEGQRIQSQAKEILTILSSIKKDYEKADDALSILQRHISNAYNQSSHVSKIFTSLGQKLSSTRTLPTSTKQEKLIE
ncbi:DNA recombination protein RmuC [Candidatus Roizmanbacteria bacterium]|nr:DNA recombination protein RmuC [Candidatus Roizmanbacteria bacterium]